MLKDKRIKVKGAQSKIYEECATKKTGRNVKKTKGEKKRDQ